MDENRVSRREWVPDEALEMLAAEKMVHPNESPEVRAQRLFIESVDQAALSLINLAVHSNNEQTRFRAATYVVERVLGTVDKIGATGSAKAPWERVQEELLNNLKAEKEAFDTDPDRIPADY